MAGDKAIPEPDIATATKAFLGAKFEKSFGRHGTFEGTVHSVTDRLAEDGVIHRNLFFHVKYTDGDREDIDWQTFYSLIKGSSAMQPPGKRAAKRPARFENDSDVEEQVPAQRSKPVFPPLAASPLQQRTAKAATAPSSKATLVPAPSGKENAAQPAAAKRSLPAVEFAQPQSKKPKHREEAKPRATRIDNSLVIDCNLPQDPAPTDSEDGFRLRHRGMAGHLYRIQLVRFMCHEHLKMDFGPHVTFISGTNGSGKSAVLQALQFCLGVQASKTGRAGSMAGFIKSGCTEAKVSVTLWNSGEDAYRHEVYGDFITITRMLRHSGGAWQMTGQQGNIVSKSREEMLQIIDHLNIDAGNPIAVLTQDMARDFLGGSSESSDRKKFQLFMEATSLAKVVSDLANAEMHVGQQTDAISAEQPKLNALKKCCKELTASLEQLEASEQWRTQAEQLSQALAWVQVDSVQADIALAEQKLAKLTAMSEQDLTTSLAEVKEEVEALEAEVQQQQAAMQSFNDDIGSLAEESTVLQREQANAKRACTRLQTAMKRLQQNIQETEQQKQVLVDTVRESQQSEADTFAHLTQQHDDRLRQQQLQAQDLHMKYCKLEQQSKSMQDQFIAAVDAECAAQTTLNRINNEVRRLQADRQTAAQHVGNRASQFGGPQMLELCRLIQGNVGQFHRHPVGPLGAVLGLTDSKWSTAADAAIGDKLNNFIVHDAHDMKLVRRMAKSAGLQRFSVTILDFNIPQHRLTREKLPPPHMTTLMQVLTCSRPEAEAVVKNILVDQPKCEKLVLCETPQQAQQAIHSGNVSAAFCPDGSRRYKRRSTLAYVPYRPPYHQRGKLGQDHSQYLQEMDALLANAQMDQMSAHANFAEATQAKQAFHEQMKASKQAFYLCRRQQDEAHRQIDITMSQAPVLPESTPAEGEEAEANSMEAEIQAKTEELWQLQQSFREEETKAREADLKLCEAKAAYHAKKAEIDAMKQRNEHRVAEMSGRADRLREKQDQVETLQSHQEQLQTLLDEWKATKEAKLKELTASKQLAAKVCAEEQGRAALQALEAAAENAENDKAAIALPVPVTPEALSAAKHKLEKQVKAQVREAGGDIAQVQLKLAVTRRKENDLRARMKNVVAAHNLAFDGLEQRRAALKERTKMITARVRNSFAELLARKKHLGTINIKDDGRLEIKVQIAGTGDKAGKTKDMKQLSGGERSYSTVALLLAIGEFANCPFRALDEYDTFQDSMNRAVSTANLFGFARHFHELQMILISPQDVTAVEEAKTILGRQENCEVAPQFVRVVEMRPARENATRAH